MFFDNVMLVLYTAIGYCVCLCVKKHDIPASDGTIMVEK